MGEEREREGNREKREREKQGRNERERGDWREGERRERGHYRYTPEVNADRTSGPFPWIPRASASPLLLSP